MPQDRGYKLETAVEANPDELVVYDFLGDALLQQRGRRGGWGVRLLTRLMTIIVRLFDRRATIDWHAPDNTLMAFTRLVPPGARAWTLGNIYLISPSIKESADELNLTVIHEYVHVLQYRAQGILFLLRYLHQGLWDWTHNIYEQQAMKIEDWYRDHPELSQPWELRELIRRLIKP